MTGPQAALLGRRLHLQHGPIDLMVEAWGDEDEVRAAYVQARDAFEGVLEGLCAELPLLRSEAGSGDFVGCVAQRMASAVSVHREFITPMAAVAGSVADYILGAMTVGRRLLKAMVNNGGDIALRLGEGESATIGIGDLQRTGIALSPVTIREGDGIGGIATSGWRGRSHSLGIADFVTVFARCAADADASATVIANAIDLPGSELVSRVPAESLSPDSDLGARLVTVDVAPLSEPDVSVALKAGQRVADDLIERNVIAAAVLGLQGQTITSVFRGFSKSNSGYSQETPSVLLELEGAG